MARHIPKLCRHPSGRGYTTDPYTSKEVYHGIHGSPECQRAYEVWLATLLTRRAEVPSGAPPGSSVTVARLSADYLIFARGYYQKHGNATTELRGMKNVLEAVGGLFGAISADSFGPSQLKAVRQQLIEKGNARKTINQQIHRLRRVWRWGVEQEIVRPETLLALEAVTSLSKGRTKALELPDVPEVPMDVFLATVGHLDAKTAAMVHLHLWACMRAEEVVILRGADIDCTQVPWCFTPWTHKTEHYDHQRRIWLGPKCRAILEPLLAKAKPSAWLFHSRQSTSALTVARYRARIVDCCERHGLPLWGPRNLRHTALTLVRQKYGLEGAQRAGGHASADVTQIYTERDEALARKIANDLG